MNDIIEKILPTIKEVVNVIVFDKESRHDLTQELIIKCYDHEGKVRRLYAETGLKNWLFLSARNVKVNQITRNKIKERITKPHNFDTDKTVTHKDFVKPTAEMLAELTETERMWICFWMECDFNYLEMQRRSGEKGIKNRISRQHAKKRITEILERWKQLDIYLPELQQSGFGLM